MKTKKIFIFIFVLASIAAFCSFSKSTVIFTDYEKFVDELYACNKLDSFEKIHEHVYSERSCVRVLITHHYKDSKIYVDEKIANEAFESREIDDVNNFLISLGKFQEKYLTDKSIKNIYDIPVSDLICLDYNVKYDNFETSEHFWLKKKDGKIQIYRYTVCLDIYE